MAKRYPRYETHFTCPFCSKEFSGLRRVQASGFSRQKKPLSQQAEDVQGSYRQSERHLNEHVAETHRPETIATRMTEIEREAKWALDRNEELDWATDPLAVEWRALMKEWWALPALKDRAARLSPTYNRSLLSKGVLAPPTAGERHMGKVASHQRKLRLAQRAA